MNEKIKLSSFTDVLTENVTIDDSQPLSLSLTNEVEMECILNKNKKQRPEKHTGQRGDFRSREEIDEKYRDVFTHQYFNYVQSKIIDDALYSDKSLVVCAPTGSGKTVVFEMAIVQLLMEMEDKNLNDDFKIIYMAPVKSLCTERLTEWYPKFTRLGLLCIEVTGDTDVDFPQLKPYRIIITTPEKWDMLTRRWKDHKSLVEVVKLFLIDEVHILNDELRGPVLEAVVSRMKTIESSAKSAHRIEKIQRQYQNIQDDNTIELPAPKIRFIAVSATVSNPEDVAKWLGTTEQPAVSYKFGDECRPVKLKLVVEGYPCAPGASIFKFDIVLNYKLMPIIQKYHNGKPTLIFCNTRKSVALTAETLSREMTVGFSEPQKAKLFALAATIKNKKLQTLILNGIGCHHAGLLYEERVNIENAFRNRDLPILITTTTLAMGVNLPAHLVIIKNTQQYMNGAYQEYSISTILQMVGRAGRPQFDTEATAVIMTRQADKARYQSLVGGSEPLQSYLHKRLAENLNSEAALGTVNDVAQCVQWVNSTFLSVRAVRDPRRYLGLPQNASPQLITRKIEELCVKAMNGLASSGLITMDEASCISSTDAGRLMSVYYIDLETMKTIMKIEGTESLERLLWLICESHELSDMHLRVDERRCLNTLNRNNAAATIRFPMKGKITTRQMKLNCIIQAVLGCLPIPDPSLNQEAMKIMRIADRVCKCLVAYVTSSKMISENPKCYSAVLNALLLAKCISAHIWENSPYLSKQLKGIGPTFSSLLASAGKVNFMLLEESHPRDLERIMNKGPPAGNVIRKQISLLPKYRLNIEPKDERTIQVKLTLLNHAYLMENMEHLTAGTHHKFYIIVGDSENNLHYFSTFRDIELLSVYEGNITCDVTRKHYNEHHVTAHCISSSFVGIDDSCEFVFKDLSVISTFYNTDNRSEENKIVKSNNVCLKRKSMEETNITQSKQKKKRETELIRKFDDLKQSLAITSKNLKKELKNSTQFSNIKDTVDLTNYKIPQNAIEEPYHFNTDQNNDDIIDLSDTEELMNEVELVNIFNDIDNKNSDDNILKTPMDKSMNFSNYPLKTNQQKINRSKGSHKSKPVKNNFSFLDKNISSEVCSQTVNDNSAFSDALKNYLNQLYENISKQKDPNLGIDLLMNDVQNRTRPNATITANICKAYCGNNEEPKEESLEEKVTETTESEENRKQDVTYNKQVHNNILTSLYDAKNNINSVFESMKIDELNDNYTTAAAEPICYPERVDWTNTSGIIMHANTPSVHKNDYASHDVTLNEKKEVKAKVINLETLKQNKMQISTLNSNNSPCISKETSNYSKNMATLRKKPLEICYNNNFPFPIENLPSTSDNDMENTNHSPVRGTTTSNPQNTQGTYKILEIRKPVNSLTSQSDSDTNREHYDINKYSFSATKIKSCSKILPERQLHIIGRVKVDLAVTEIKTKHQTEPKENAMSPDLSDLYATNEITDTSSTIQDNKETYVKDNLMGMKAEQYKTLKTNEEKRKIEFIKQDNIRQNINYNITDIEENEKVQTITQKNTISVNDILQKYRNKINTSQNNPKIPVSTSQNTSEIKHDSRKQKSIHKRQYKLRDLDKIDITLPESFTAISLDVKKVQDDVCREKVPETEKIYAKKLKPPYNTIPETKANEHCNIIPIEISDEDIEPILPVDTEMDNDHDDIDLSQAMLDPKTLLQSAQQEIILPPPPEFSDTAYSPAFDNFNDYSRSEDVNFRLEDNHKTYEPHLRFTPGSNVEEWSLSTEEPKFALSYSPRQIQDQSCSFSLSENLSQRQANFNRFKFSRKQVFNLNRK